MERNILKKYRSFFNFVVRAKNNIENQKNIEYGKKIYMKNISKSNYNVKTNSDNIYDNKLFLKYWIRKKRPGARN
ncbi:conserved Plasmodium protein, unknown function [Plasmodium chabaudi chabaudi]|uniref:Uncharacterized protein n=4 Tax=Plasmodium (Vinckeia) TaxID=418101 RepID=A0A077TQT3_PLACU|nr:conserved Plasmodium protein, unknown function [Plasmodium vinckei vinckei]XP_016654881.1 conserved protein, unknown function [Plasmodium chabaudi chabaudi]CAD2104212.1 conserved Plasmodium protein, unknown function [Plasmodium vinckei brucechwatti]SCN62784.1 conserved Plasmodium protein, unknown function [Plasmodium chabaudi adami]KEG04244.1 hypothetical protein YYE_01150 [Plasmodium vinckei vinckei]SCM26103.1 conserved Plasmodium protein, unknown function [Plasmodium chabaudi chabaudi]SC|eukprot:XP_016654881.1 conserved Plasmodium protein, unknown function [Plasmodium chabaudi chabaudi]